MNKLIEVKLKYVDNKPHLTDVITPGKIIAGTKQLGCIAEIKNFSGLSHKINQNFRDVTANDLDKIARQGGACFIETEEARRMAHSWDKPINSYALDDPMYYDVIRLIDGKVVIYY